MVNVVVRTGSPEDEEGVMALCRAIHAENAIFSMNEDKVRAMVRLALWRTQGIVGLIGSTDALEGMILLHVNKFWYSDEDILEDMFNFVPPAFRSVPGGRAGKLIDFAKKASDEIGIPLLIGVVSNARTEAKVHLYGRKLGSAAGAFFLYNAKTGITATETVH